MKSDILDIETSIKEKKQELLKGFIVLFSLILSFYVVVFYKLDYMPEVYLNTSSIVFIIISYYVFTKKNYSFDTIFILGMVANAGLIFIKVLFFWDVIPLVFLWFIAIPASTIIFGSFTVTLFWTLIVVILSVSAPVVSDYLNLRATVLITPKQMLIINLSAFIFEIFYVIFFIYYNHIFQKLKNKLELLKALNEGRENIRVPVSVNKIENNAVSATDKTEVEKPFKKTALENDEKYEKLLQDIDYYFKNKAPYRDPEFSINKLAFDLNSNVSYISRAFKQSKEQNFKTYLNTYRISLIKQRLNKKEHLKYTLKHIYQDAGFVHQPTFNRVFKEVEGITPSEYIEKMN